MGKEGKISTLTRFDEFYSLQANMEEQYSVITQEGIHLLNQMTFAVQKAQGTASTLVSSRSGRTGPGRQSGRGRWHVCRDRALLQSVYERNVLSQKE